MRSIYYLFAFLLTICQVGYANHPVLSSPLKEEIQETMAQAVEEAQPHLSDISLKVLKDCPEVIPTLADWVYEDWSSYNPSLTREKMIASFQGKLNDDQLPLALVAFKNGQPVGVISLKKHETEELADLENGCVWGGSLHVLTEERNQGIGELLAKTAALIAKRLGYTEIRFFLSQGTSVAWCTQRGAEILQLRPFQGHWITVLRFDLLKDF